MMTADCCRRTLPEEAPQLPEEEEVDSAIALSPQATALPDRPDPRERPEIEDVSDRD